ISELGTLLSYRFNHNIALKQVGLIHDSSILYKVYSDSLLERGALAWWKKYADQKFSYVDCVSFEFLKKLGIKDVLTFDKDFIIAGFSIAKM
ncbi:MAG: hypothetical protein ABIA63_01325, partial [bacterium]